MSEHGLHTHAPHEEALHHGAGSGHSLGQWVAIFTAILAAFGAVVSYQGSHLMNEVLLYKNEAVLEKARATDQWNYYQAVSTKLHLLELGSTLDPDKARQFAPKIQKYTEQKSAILEKARTLEAQSAKADAESARLNRPHNDMEIAMIFLQIAISLASITALTRRTWLFGLGILSALGGIGLWAAAMLAI
ncbi:MULTISPECIES: DUF4337 domain-containing protein [Acidithiobacillus]|jgi:hypothetical protein|uniref:Transmembrane protein n=4 Tax=Acidithiobacillus caldus TaxID=33059 RepID=F9ZQ65_ACICS|nr:MULTISPECIES: DUF4337 domain-containing protein [Acidithiobacillus]AEK56902.1 putative transmembrane protein [Acidithiobacillus caldus SM-1]AIA54169.1 putative transmembrane protein [Acidithiobacillus caldus ATCC 51756]AUW31700.1 DUF4337 domain-containing protein [Acidithiobacillus caldus]MBU2730487.1 DUF4337 domain-containing protein [Acidithiobacillus caldus]MBU2736873.1 DUF4337 domain-containing protein [Acidithiobacillus caldus ATCC 51756]